MQRSQRLTFEWQGLPNSKLFEHDIKQPDNNSNGNYFHAIHCHCCLALDTACAKALLKKLDVNFLLPRQGFCPGSLKRNPWLQPLTNKATNRILIRLQSILVWIKSPSCVQKNYNHRVLIDLNYPKLSKKSNSWCFTSWIVHFRICPTTPSTQGLHPTLTPSPLCPDLCVWVCVLEVRRGRRGLLLKEFLC